MPRVWPSNSSVAPPPFASRDRAVYGLIASLGALLYWLSNSHPARMPVWAPWDFSALEYLAAALTIFWFLRGLERAPPGVGPPYWRRASFLIGLAVIHLVLQTRFEYWSQHMFFLNRLQQVVINGLGPFLLALGDAGATLKRGMPGWTRRLIETPAATGAIRLLQQPVPAALLFSGLFCLWLVPGIHFRAMIDVRLYALMNWSMVLAGILFWCLVLDPRPKPPARVSFGTRAALAVAVMFPQIALGAAITFSQHDLYPYYDLCGRLFPSIGALADQHIGGIVIWIPPAMMSVLATLIVVNQLRLSEERRPAGTRDKNEPAALASRWTGA